MRAACTCTAQDKKIATLEARVKTLDVLETKLAALQASLDKMSAGFSSDLISLISTLQTDITKRALSSEVD